MLSIPGSIHSNLTSLIQSIFYYLNKVQSDRLFHDRIIGHLASLITSTFRYAVTQKISDILGPQHAFTSKFRLPPSLLHPNRLSTTTGIGDPGDAHVFSRHTTATLMIAKGCDSRIVKEPSRHRYNRTSLRYANVSDKTRRESTSNT